MMKVLKRLAAPAVALFLLGIMAGCQKPLSGGDSDGYGGGRWSERDREKMRQKAEREKANGLLASGMMQASQALVLAQNGLQLKLHGNATLDSVPAPTAAPEPEQAELSEAGPLPDELGAEEPGVIPPEEEPSAEPPTDEEPAGEPEAPAETVGAEEEGRAAAGEPAPPAVPELVPQGTLAIQLIDQAYATLETAEDGAEELFAGPYSNEPRVESLKDLLDATELLIITAARMEPVNEDILLLLEQDTEELSEGPEEAEEGAELGADEPAGELPAAEAAEDTVAEPEHSEVAEPSDAVEADLTDEEAPPPGEIGESEAGN